MMVENESTISSSSNNNNEMPLGTRHSSNIRKGNAVYGLSFHSINHEDAENEKNISHNNGFNNNGFNHDDDESNIDGGMDGQSEKSNSSSSNIRLHENSSSPIQEYGFGRLNTMQRYTKRFSFRRPKLFGAIVVCVTCVLPLFVTIIILGSALSGKYKISQHLHKNKNNNSNGNSNSNLIENYENWEIFSKISQVSAVATDNSICSAIAQQIMTQGGNAVDAGVAAALCLGVISPGKSHYVLLCIDCVCVCVCGYV